jgi:type VI secretion system protein ImpF
MSFGDDKALRSDTRLSPPLMHVFRSAHRKRREAAQQREDLGGAPPTDRKTRPHRTPIDERELKAEVERDVDALMNHVAIDSTIDLEAFPHVRRSILNFGFPDIAHRSLDELESRDLDGEIVAVLRQYEPRLIPGTIHVTRDRSPEANSELRYIVDGHLLCQPLNVPIEFLAKFEATTGKLLFRRR